MEARLASTVHLRYNAVVLIVGKIFMKRWMAGLLIGFGLINTAFTAPIYGTPGSPAVSKEAYNSGLYVTGALSYMLVDYNTTLNWGDSKRGDSTFAYGGALGYQFGPHFAIEAGGYSNVYSQLKSMGSLVIKPYNGVEWYSLYAAGRLMVPVYTDVNVYVKLGVGYQHYTLLANSPLISGYKTVSYQILPMYSAGFSYRVTQSLSVNLAYTHFVGNRQVSFPDPGSTLITKQVKFSNDPGLFTLEATWLF